MKKIILLGLTVVLVSGCGAAVKTVIRGDFDPAGRVAVMPFGGRDEDTGLSLAESFTTYLMEAGFEVIERAQLESVLKEQKVSLSGAMGADAVAQVGKLAGVSAVVTGSYRVRQEETRTVIHQPNMPNMQNAARRPGKPGNRMRPARWQKQAPGKAETRIKRNTVFRGLTVKFVDVNSGRVLMSSSAEKEYDADSVNKALSAMARSIKKNLEKARGGR